MKDDLISRKSLYDKMSEAEDLARQRVIDTPSSFPNGSLNPAYIRYMTQLSERTRFREMIYDEESAERKKGKWIDDCACSICHWIHENDNGFALITKYNFCPNCGADMRKEKENADNSQI